MGVLDGKAVIVTGAARGIGKGMATALIKAGAAVTITDIKADVLEATKRELEAIRGAKVLACLADGGDRQAVRDVIRRVIEAHGRIDMVVNNAQATQTNLPLEDHTKEILEISLDSGFYASFYYMAEAFPHLKETKGTVVNFGSDAGLWGNVGMLGYNASKEAIRALTRTAAREWAQYGITVNAIIPGMKTEGAFEVFEKNPGHLEKRLAQIPLGRLGDPEKDAGGLVLFLATDAAKYMTGETFNINGGVNMRP